MAQLLALLVSVLASLAIYLSVFAWVHKPLTTDVIDQVMSAKQALGAQQQGPRLFVMAGSNGSFSHRCEALQPLIGRPCVNLSVVAGISLDYLFLRYGELFRAGDALYLPLEYEQYTVQRDAALSGPENALIYRRGPSLWQSMDPLRVLHAAGHFDLSFLIQGLAEMALDRLKVQRRFGVETLNAHGDESGHTPSKGEPYRPFIEAMNWRPPTADWLAYPSYGKERLAVNIAALRAAGITIIGGLPTVFDAPTLDNAVVEMLSTYYRSLGADFIALDNRSQYPRDCFYDSPYHLHEDCQRRHSALLAPWLIPLLTKPP